MDASRAELKVRTWVRSCAAVHARYSAQSDANVRTWASPGSLGCSQRASSPISTPSSTRVPRSLFAVPPLLPDNFETTAIEAHLQRQGVGAIISRDVLSHAVLVCIGYLNEFTLAI
jgi:hypothetical protein